MLPRWREHWQHSIPAWRGVLTLTVGRDACMLDVGTAGIRLLNRPLAHSHAVNLDPQVFTQLLFGYRPLSWAAGQPNQRIPDYLMPLLHTLFPPGHAWIAGTGGF